MGKRGRPRKKSPAKKAEQCYTLVSSDEDTPRLPSPSQRRGVGLERPEPVAPPSPPTTRVTRQSASKKPVVEEPKTPVESSADSDATEV